MLGDDHSSLPNFSKSPIPRSRDRDATIPEDKSGRLPFLCFVLHRMGFFVPRELLASGDVLPRLFPLACTLLPKNRRYLFCDPLRHRSFSTETPACFTRHAAVWCSDFPPASRKQLASDHLPSANNLSQPA